MFFSTCRSLAAPLRLRRLRDLERFDAASVRHVRSATEIDQITAAVQRDFLTAAHAMSTCK